MAQFFDEPKFTVAGVTDNTYRGGHGSDTILRSTEALTKAAASLGGESGAKDARRNANEKHSDYDTAIAYADSGDFGRARSLARELLAHQDEAALHHLLAKCDEKLGDPLEAVREYQRAAEMNPDEPFIFDWGTELLIHRTAAPAIEVFSKGNKLYPVSVRMRLGLCSALYSNGDYERAAHCFFEASDLNPNDPQPYLFLGQVQSKEITASEGYLERLARFQNLQGENAWANYLYAAALDRRRQGPEQTGAAARAKRLLEKAIAIDPKLGPAHLELGTLDEQQGDLSEAIAQYQKAIEVSPELQEAHYRLSQAFTKTGAKLEAQKELTLYQALSKTSADLLERERRDTQRFVILLQRSGAQ